MKEKQRAFKTLIKMDIKTAVYKWTGSSNGLHNGKPKYIPVPKFVEIVMKAIEKRSDSRDAEIQRLREALEELRKHGKEAMNICECAFGTFDIANKALSDSKEEGE